MRRESETVLVLVVEDPYLSRFVICVELEKRKFSRVLSFEKTRRRNSKIFAYIFCLRAINDTTHDALATPRIDARNAPHDVFKLTRGNTRKKRRLDRSQHRNSDRKRRARYNFEAEQEEESFENRLATTGKLSGERGGERVTGDEVREHAIY